MAPFDPKPFNGQVVEEPSVIAFMREAWRIGVPIMHEKGGGCSFIDISGTKHVCKNKQQEPTIRVALWHR